MFEYIYSQQNPKVADLEIEKDFFSWNLFIAYSYQLRLSIAPDESTAPPSVHN